MVRAATNGMVDEPWPAQLNKAVWEKRKVIHADKKAPPLVVSIGQVVPHEVMGMANFNKNLFVGVGGLEAINLSHFIGAVYGMEKMMGRADNPLRAILNRASEEFLERQLDLWYVLTVVAPNGSLRGLFIGNTIECYTKACELSMAVNFSLLEKSPSTMVVYLDPDEFHSTWLGNKSIYRTRLAIADGGDLIVLAPGIRRFGEDDAVDGLIRKYGYAGTPRIMNFLRDDETGVLQNNLGAIAHLIHGSTEGRFSVTYCPGHLSREETEGVGFRYAPLNQLLQKYDPSQLTDGWNTDPETGEDFFFISNPALGLWAVPSRFEQ
jgi:nickel-dependent lactate racemase